jgi:asparagine synthase (glutamine-hydrolysing)
MCAICGIFRPDGELIDPRRVERMRDAMAARGPDGFGLTHGQGFVLGHRRLSVIDLSDAGAQPMPNEDSSIQVVLNGEIYNFQDLRRELEARHRFRSRTDTEILVHGYEEWGLEGLLKRIRGMYAFALLDRRRNEIHLARDPLGKKPLFFQWRARELIFASSARAMSLATLKSPDIAPTAVYDLLWHLYIPGPRSIFKDVEKLTPGGALTITRAGARRDFIHWRPDFLHPEFGTSAEEWLERLEATLTRAIQRRLIADVPLGVLLSGGVDSSLVVALAAKTAGRIKTFSVATEDPASDESQYAQAVARHCETEHHCLLVQSDIGRELPRLVAAMGEPLGDSSAANLFAISKEARQFVTVVLSGDGGDELFGGYSHYWAYFHAGRLRRWLPSGTHGLVEGAGRALCNAPGLLHRAGTFLRFAGAPLERSFRQTNRILDEQTAARLFTSDFQCYLQDHDPTGHYADTLAEQAEATPAAPVDRVMQAQLRTLMVDDYLMKTDLATMAASLEARCPLLDLDMVELAMRIPAAIRFYRGQPKGLLRELARRHVPRQAIDRRKQGFLAPINRWLGKEWRELVDDLVLGPQIERRGWFVRGELERIVAEVRHGNTKGNRVHLLWSLLVLELWLRTPLAWEQQGTRTAPEPAALL